MERVIADARAADNGWVSGQMDPDCVQSVVAAGRLWLDIHDRLPETATRQALPAGGRRVSVADLLETAATEIRMCGHYATAFLVGDHWVHPQTMTECTDPPITHGPDGPPV